MPEQQGDEDDQEEDLESKKGSQMWQAISPCAATPELIPDVYGVIGEEAERISTHYGS